MKDARYTLEKVGQERALPLKGLFIGIDRYQSPGIDWLSCARRDAAASLRQISAKLGVGYGTVRLRLQSAKS